jgi:predicted MFS family arabinose efflux permease
MGAVMGAFSVASVLGVPIGLRIATWGGWRMPVHRRRGMGVVVGRARALEDAADARPHRAAAAHARPRLLRAARRRDDPPAPWR